MSSLWAALCVFGDCNKCNRIVTSKLLIIIACYMLTAVTAFSAYNDKLYYKKTTLHYVRNLQ